MINIGEVVAVVGVDITLRANDSSNLETVFFKGEKFKGVSIRELISISHGFRDIVCVVEGEYLDERLMEGDGPTARPVRRLKARPIGYFEDAAFFDGIKFLPKIGDVAYLVPERQVAQVYERRSVQGFIIGKLLKEELPISLPWRDLFNSHIGIFGNTGSGKSNTLAKLFTTLFDNMIDRMVGRSKFIILDFNGEYTGNQLAQGNFKSVMRLKSRSLGGDRFNLSDADFWDAETLGVLFQATANTQKPFLRRVVSGRTRYAGIENSLGRYFLATFPLVLNSRDPSLEALEQLKHLARLLNGDGELLKLLSKVGLLRNGSSFHLSSDDGVRVYFDSSPDFVETNIMPIASQIEFHDVKGIDELQVRASLQIIRDVLRGSAQYDHIHPLLRRIDSLRDPLSKVISVGGEDWRYGVVNVISLRETNAEIKKILPLLIAKQFYTKHKEVVTSPPTQTVHLIIDEAHNILSMQSARESESWKDYRLELFEEIIKEGRKFGMFITLASQRPSDISPTIVSQIHNFFIHRLVNDRDLALLENAISTLDAVSRSQIPTLPKGACVVTGTTFEIPMLLQVERLQGDKEPDSRDVELSKIWI